MNDKPRWSIVAELPRWLVVCVLFLAVAVAGVVDFSVGREFSLRFLYILPIVAGACWCGLPAALAVAFVGSSLYLVQSAPAGVPPHDWGPSIAEVGVRLAVFSAIAVLTSQLVQSQRQQQRLARTDALTRLNNRQAFLERAEQERNRCLRRGDAVTVAYLDVDDFKSVNDQWGHMVGDDVLMAIGDALSRNVRSYDVVARLGGDEFALLLPQTDETDARPVLERLRNRLAELAADRGWPITWSIGVVTFLTAPGSVTAMIHAVDEAMYAVKRSGKGSIRYESIEPDGGGVPDSSTGNGS